MASSILNHYFSVPPALRQAPPGLTLNGSPGREVERDIYGGNFLMLPLSTAYGLRVVGVWSE